MLSDPFELGIAPFRPRIPSRAAFAQGGLGVFPCSRDGCGGIADFQTSPSQRRFEFRGSGKFFCWDFELWVSVNFAFRGLYVRAFRDVRVVCGIREGTLAV